MAGARQVSHAPLHQKRDSREQYFWLYQFSAEGGDLEGAQQDLGRVINACERSVGDSLPANTRSIIKTFRR